MIMMIIMMIIIIVIIRNIFTTSGNKKFGPTYNSSIEPYRKEQASSTVSPELTSNFTVGLQIYNTFKKRQQKSCKSITTGK
jgi:hypothetical protein